MWRVCEPGSGRRPGLVFGAGFRKPGGVAVCDREVLMSVAGVVIIVTCSGGSSGEPLFAVSEDHGSECQKPYLWRPDALARMCSVAVLAS
jgi:hypothetical protein